MEIGVAIRRGYRRKDRHVKKMKKQKNRKGDEYAFNRRFTVNAQTFSYFFPVFPFHLPVKEFTRDIVSDRISRARNKSHRRSHFLADRRSGANCFSTVGSVGVCGRDRVRQLLFTSTRNHSRVSPTKRNGCSLRVGFCFPPRPVIRSFLFSFLRTVLFRASSVPLNEQSRVRRTATNA